MDVRLASCRVLVPVVIAAATCQVSAQAPARKDPHAFSLLVLRAFDERADLEPPAAPLHSARRRVRGLSPPLQELLADGYSRSPTFARLMRALDATDVIVQIEDVRQLRRNTPARVIMAAVTADVRFLRLQIGPRCIGDDRIALVGHELFHALEIAVSPDVRDEDALLALYRRIGYRAGGPYQFDTAEALVIEQRIRRELADGGNQPGR